MAYTRNKLETLTGYVSSAYRQWHAGELQRATLDRVESDLYEYVEGLLAEKNAEIKRLEANQMPSDFKEMYALYLRDEERGDPDLRDMRFAGYAAAFFTRFLRLMNPDWK
jgi:hypothetical protein